MLTVDAEAVKARVAELTAEVARAKSDEVLLNTALEQLRASSLHLDEAKVAEYLALRGEAVSDTPELLVAARILTLILQW